MIAPEVLDAMVSAGCTAEQIVAAVKAGSQADAEKLARKRLADAERKRKQRANVTRTSCDIEGHGVTSEDPPFSDKERSPTPPKEINSNPRETKRARGSRLSPEWAPSPENIAYATSQGLVGEVMAREVEKFRNYWTAKAGQSAVKLDWDATWRNWIRNARPARATPHEPRKTAHQLHQEACDRELNKVIFGNDYHDERSDNIIDLAAADYRYR